MTFAQTLNAIASTLLAWINSLSAAPDPTSQAASAALTRVVNTLITDASQANAVALEGMLAGDASALKRLSAFTSQADATAKTLATDQANVTRFVNLATSIGNVIVSAAGGNIGGCATALASACNDLGIATV